MSGFGICEVVFGILVIGIADLYLPTAEPFIFRQAKDDGAAAGFDIRVCRKEFDLLVGDLLGGGRGLVPV